jgi:hypothetical protein
MARPHCKQEGADRRKTYKKKTKKTTKLKIAKPLCQTTLPPEEKKILKLGSSFFIHLLLQMLLFSMTSFSLLLPFYSF